MFLVTGALCVGIGIYLHCIKYLRVCEGEGRGEGGKEGVWERKGGRERGR